MKKVNIFLGVVVVTIVMLSCEKPSITQDDGVFINGVKWATRNVGATGTFVYKSEEYGGLYQWNRKDTANFLLYKDYFASAFSTETYWLLANNPCPQGWRIPTYYEFRTLLDTSKVKNEWVEQGGIFGRKFTDLNTKNSIFIPAAGYRGYNGSAHSAGVCGCYWSCEKYINKNAYYFYFYGSGANLFDGNEAYGFFIRPVAE